ncbi:MAG: hypothetical protein EHM27_07190, partial [Deltaproteobacteria bacterium]
MMRLRYDIGKLQSGYALLPFANVITLYILGRTIMINNTSLQKWSRLAQKQLDRQFVNEIRTGLQCSPFESSAIL